MARQVGEAFSADGGGLLIKDRRDVLRRVRETLRKRQAGGVANHTPVTVAIELGAEKIYVLPVGYPWLNREPTNALGMALHALARIVEQKLEAEVTANRAAADIHLMPAHDLADVSPADFSHTRELIEWGYSAARRDLGSSNGRADVATPDKPKKALSLQPNPARAA